MQSLEHFCKFTLCTDAPVTKDAKAEPPPTDTVTVILDDDDDESKCIDKKRARDGSDDCSFPTKEDAKKLRSSSPEKVRNIFKFNFKSRHPWRVRITLASHAGCPVFDCRAGQKKKKTEYYIL